MKKTINVNLNGRVFTMDEDAFRLLDRYLNNLRIYFRKEEGSSEIIADFEARIEELFSEKSRLGYEVITIEHVEEVIARVGKPDDFSEQEEEKEEKQSNFTEVKDGKKKFFRNIDDKFFGGVCSGVAAYFGMDVLAIRIIAIIFIFLTSGGIIPVYLIAWLVLPAAQTVEHKLQMMGKPITVENIGKTVAAEAEPVRSNEHNGCLSGFIDLFVGLMKVCLIGLGFLIGLPLIFVLFIVLIVLFALLFGIGGGLLGIIPSFMIASNPVLATTALLFVIGIPVVALIYAIIAYFAKLKPLNKAVNWVFIILWILALVMFLFSGFRIDKNDWFKNVNWSQVSNNQIVKGDGLLSKEFFELDYPVSTVTIGRNLNANLQVEQVESDKTSIEISGDGNLIEQVKYEINEGNLELLSYNLLKSENDMIIRLKTKKLKGIGSDIGGNIKINGAFTGNELEIKLKGPGNFRADSLYINSLTVKADGIASVDLSGKTNKTRLDLSGAGNIDAYNLLSDTVYAYVEGVGSIKCNPVDYLEGSLKGVGKITYKEEPRIKNISSEGIGKIGKE